MADKTVVVRIVVRANQFSSGLRGASADTQKFAVDVERATERAGSSALALGAASATAGKLMLVGIGGAMVVSAKAAIDYESSMAGVAKTTDLAGSSFAKAGSPLAAFGEGLRTLSQRIPMNVNDLAKIAELGGQLGIEVPNLIEFTEVMAALGVSTNMGAEEAATGLARFVNIMGTGQDQFNRLGATVVDLGNNLATTESEILNFGLRLAPIGKTVGLTEEEVFGLSGALTSLGVPAERGGTALQRFFLDMQSAVESGGSSLEAFARAAHMSVEEFTTVFRESPAEAFTTILRGLSELQEKGGSASGTLRDLGVNQQRSIQVLLAASNGWEVVADSIDRARTAGEEQTALFEEAGRRYGTTASQIQLVSNAFTDLRIEIGNALLGSGGLAAGMDFVREFIRIIKDNLPLIGRLAGAMAAVAAVRIGAGFLQGINEGITRLRAMRVGMEGVTRASIGMKLGMLGVNTAVFAAVAVAAVLITRWAAAAAKAAELRRESRLLQEQIDAGQDPVEAMVDLLTESNVLTDRRLKLLHDAGISEERFARAVLDGGDALGGLREQLEDSIGLTDRMRSAMESGGVGRDFRLPPGMLDAMREIDELFGGGGERGESFLAHRATEIRNALIEAGLGAEHSADMLDRIARRAAETRPFDMDPGDIARSIAAFTVFPETIEDMAGRTVSSSEDVKLSWEQMVLGLEDGSNRIADFYDNMTDGADEFRGILTESFDEVRNTIMSGFPTWDEYEQVSIDSLNGVIEAQNAYLEDLRDGFELQETLTGQVSDRVMAFIEGLDPATKGALARFRRTNQSGFSQWVDDVDANLAEASEHVDNFWSLELPGAQERGFATLFGMAVQEAKAFGLPGEQTAQAIMDGLQTQMQALTESEQDEFLGFIANMFQNEAFLNSIGLDIGNPLVAGIIESLGRLSSRAGPVISEQMRRIENMMKSSARIESPSKMTQEIGMEITRGLFVGMEDEFTRQMRMASNPAVSIINPNPVVNVSVPVAGGSRDLHIYYPEHKDDDITDAIQKSSFLNGLQRTAETARGLN